MKAGRNKHKYHVHARGEPAGEMSRILKYGETIALLNRCGDIDGAGFGEMGLFYRETRHLSKQVLTLNGSPPLLLSSIIHDENTFLSVDLTNFDMSLENGETLQRETIHLYRSKFVLDGTCYDEIRIMNYGRADLSMELSLLFDADFADVFEIRGTKRQHHGERVRNRVGEDTVVACYRGTDGTVRRTKVQFSPRPRMITAKRASYALELKAKRQTVLFVNAACQQQEEQRRVFAFGDGYNRILAEAKRTREADCRITGSSLGYSAWFARSLDDLYLLTVGNPEGPYPYAGVPWFNTVFGRDGIITALETMWMSPGIAHAVLSRLSELQATARDDERDAQPGKILHEMRRGEMAKTGEVPFGCYYGSVDSTPLYVILAGVYLLRTGDSGFLRGIWPNIKAALEWIEKYGDLDGDHFIEYSRQSKEGLVQQGWKDSHDSVFHADGRLAKPPIALCEVQGYAYAARRFGARIARRLGESDFAAQLEDEAEKLRARFEEAFWIEEAGSYAMALDGDKKPCTVQSSNAGQALFCRIVSPERSRRVRDAMMCPGMFSGWGVRTLSSDEARYNPMSYHNGSVWPHDNALIALGLSLYGMQKDAARILRGMKEASQFFDLRRVPELFCGFHKREDSSGPTLYPVACSPQAWSAGACPLLVRAALGLTVRAEKPQIQFMNPHLPEDLDEICIENLAAGDGSADIALRKVRGSVDVQVIRKEGDIEIAKTLA